MDNNLLEVFGCVISILKMKSKNTATVLLILLAVFCSRKAPLNDTIQTDNQQTTNRIDILEKPYLYKMSETPATAETKARAANHGHWTNMPPRRLRKRR
jgi:hypothetical protein